MIAVHGKWSKVLFKCCRLISLTALCIKISLSKGNGWHKQGKLPY